jgi:hypothetical protein
LSAEPAFLHLLHAAEREGSRFTHAQVSSWDPSDLKAFTGLGILERIDGTIADCPDCEIGHVGEVHVTTDPAGRDRRHLACPMHGRVEVTAESSQEWVVRPGAFATAVAKAFGTNRSPNAHARGVWKLGRCTIGEASREVILLLNAAGDDGRDFTAHVGQSGRAIVVVPVREPRVPDRIRFAPAVVPLAEAAACTTNGIEIDPRFVLDLIRAADEDTRLAREQGGDSPRMRKRIQKMVREESKVQLTDDLLVGAYVRTGSLDKAAAALSEELGRKVSRDSIHRALNRQGGIDAVRATHDSGSVLRVVASQPRDRAKRIAQSGN